MSPLEKRRINAAFKRLECEASMYERRAHKMNCLILKGNQEADSQWNEMFHDQGKAYGIGRAVSEVRKLLRYMEKRK